MARSLARQAVLQMMYIRILGGAVDEDTTAFVYEVMKESKSEESNKIYATKDDRAYIQSSLEGTIDHEKELDELLNRFIKDSWSMDRVSCLDRCILRLAAFEILFQEKVPDSVAVSEALRLADLYSEPKVKPFINGILRSVEQSKTTAEDH